MAHALLAISRPSKRAASPSTMSTDESSNQSTTTSNSNNNNNNSQSLSLRHQYSITSASTSSTLYTCSEEDEDELSGELDGHGDAVVSACEEVIQDSRLNGAGLPIPWHSVHNQENSNNSTSSSSSSKKSKEKAANHAMRFKRRGGSSSRASLTTLGEDWLPRPSSASASILVDSPSKATSSHASTSSPTKTVLPSCTCQLENASDDRSNEEEDGISGELGDLSIDDQLDKMIKMTSDLLRISKGVLTSSKRVSVTKASESQIQYSHEHALRQHLESLETQDRFMHFVSNEAHSILTSAEDIYSPLSSGQSLPQSYAPPPLARARLRPHSSNGSISAPVIRATTMYVNAEMDGSGIASGNANAQISGIVKHGNRERHASVTSHATGSSGLGSVKEEVEAFAQDDTRASAESNKEVSITTSTPAHANTNASKAISRKPSQLSDISISSSNGLLGSVSAVNKSTQGQPSSATMNTGAEGSSSVLSPTLSQATTTSSSTPSSTFFSSFWSRSTNVSSSSSIASSSNTPNTTMEASPSLSRFLARKSAPPMPPLQPTPNAQEGKKDARGMLSALAASSPPLPPHAAEADKPSLSPPPQETAYSSTLVPPLSPTISTSSTAPSSSMSQSQQGFESRSPPQMPASSSSTAALAQLSAIHSSPHLTVSSRPRHRASLSESLLRASWSGSNLKSDAVASSTGASKNASSAKPGEKSHKRSRHSTSPAVQYALKR